MINASSASVSVLQMMMMMMVVFYCILCHIIIKHWIYALLYAHKRELVDGDNDRDAKLGRIADVALKIC